ncbi:hypothetical protein OZX62_01555 [Bifidobacterium sp. ESL0690]|uniref:hypothetical protein n=1 Tax=Bifidobacterium sp. ESL0690 TaxID=2983214 RepID=UPI0023F65673|nr:hypothetical protein [Bifidobacterium sp. ESL0690]WEV47011.1 hypothetical protein OZX62_01555 [Bifidobacterium sp. ESL0690]
MSKHTELTYTDGRTETCKSTLFESMQAERYAKANGWGTPDDSPISFMAYASYAALRKAGKIQPGQTFEQWAQTVATINYNAEDESEEANVYDPLPPSGLPAASASSASSSPTDSAALPGSGDMSPNPMNGTGALL